MSLLPPLQTPIAIVLFFLSALVIYFSCELFVNAVEWFGSKLNLSATATGTVLAAFGTALPESAVTFSAVAFGHQAGKELGVGAALGGPLVLATIGYGVVGWMLVKSRRPLKGQSSNRIPIARLDDSKLARDQMYFLVIFALKVALGYLAFPGKHWTALVFVLMYAAYVWREVVGGDGHVEEEVREPLKFDSSTMNPSLFKVLAQLIVALTAIGLASHAFVNQMSLIGGVLGLPPHLIALFLSPIATELPETMNAVIWVRCGKERLALANISGAMMIQATIPSALGLYFTPWIFDQFLTVAALITGLTIVYLYMQFRRGPVNGRVIARAGWFYFLFFVSALVIYLKP